MMKPIRFIKRPHPLLPMVDIISECKNSDDTGEYIAGVFAIIRIAEIHKGKLMDKKPEYMSRKKNSIIFSFTIVFPNMEEREKFLRNRIIIGTIGPS